MNTVSQRMISSARRLNFILSTEPTDRGVAALRYAMYTHQHDPRWVNVKTSEEFERAFEVLLPVK